MVCDRFLCGQFRDSLVAFIHSARSVCSVNLTRSMHSTNLTRSAHPRRFAPLALFLVTFELQVRQFPYSRNTRLPLQGPNLKQSAE